MTQRKRIASTQEKKKDEDDRVTVIEPVINLGRELTAQSLLKLDDCQEAKADAGKPRLSLVPMEILNAIARVREYGNKKYGDPDNWKTVSPERYRDAMLRHAVAYINDPNSRDEESGLPHLWHLACNVSFLTALEK